MKNQTQLLTYPSLFETLVLESAENNAQKIIRYAVLAFGGSALIALCAQIIVPFYPVPVTMQTFAVFLIGLTYGWRLGGLTVALYLLEGAIGLPVFHGGKGGMIVLMGPTAGYLYGLLSKNDGASAGRQHPALHIRFNMAWKLHRMGQACF